MATISDRLKEIRDRKHLSVAKIARIMNKGESEVQRWISGKHVPGGKNLLGLADAMGVVVSDILGAPDEHECAKALGLDEVVPFTQREILLVVLHRRLCGHSDALGDHAVGLFEKFLEQLDGQNKSPPRKGRKTGR